MPRSLLAAAGVLFAAALAFAAPAKPHEAWGAGVIEKVDPAARSLVLKQGAHEMTFAVADAAQVLEGKTSRTLEDLSKDVGRQAKVRYMMTGGTKTADRVEVSTRPATHAAK
ncbi:MAG TPA: hypothetical protein VL263_10760 [Vicinamibacterales bacterium]|jgi:hypothetical protein|nr:hypothetical protein [Vicinamibacterales bacterium]